VVAVKWSLAERCVQVERNVQAGGRELEAEAEAEDEAQKKAELDVKRCSFSIGPPQTVVGAGPMVWS